MTPALARIKRAVRRAVHLSGGVDGAAATVERKRSVVGDWNNLNHAAFPSLDRALPLDEVAVAQGHAPPILSAYAAELGHVCVRLPDGGAGEDALTGALIDASAEFGDVAGAVRDATRNGRIDQAERDRIMAEIDEAAASLARMRLLVVTEAVAKRGKRSAQHGGGR